MKLTSQIAPLAAAVLAACGGSSTPTTTATTAPVVATAPAAPSKPARSSFDPYSVIAPRADIVVVARPRQLEGTDLGRIINLWMGQDPNVGRLRACGLQTLTDIDVFVLGFQAFSKGAAFSRGGVTRRLLDRCVRDSATKLGKRVIKRGDTYMIPDGRDTAYLQFRGDGVVLTTVDPRTGYGGGASPEIRGLIQGFDSNALVSFAAMASYLKEDVDENPFAGWPERLRPETLVANLSYDGGLRLSGVLTASSDKAAAAVVARLRALVSRAKASLGALGTGIRLRVSHTGAQVSGAVELDRSLLDTFLTVMLKQAQAVSRP